VLLVLESWAAFVVAGLAFAKTAEHARPATAYDIVLLASELGTLAVLLGIVLAVRPLLAFLRAGGWREIHRPVLRATAATGLTAIVLVVVVAWAHQLTNGQRNGGDGLYSAAFIVLFVCVTASIGLWTRAAVVTARHLPLNRASLRREAFLAATTTITMAVMTVSATIWWASVYGSLSVRMIGITGVMLAATALATAGTVRAVRTDEQVTQCH
jgi:hypothetical protein